MKRISPAEFDWDHSESIQLYTVMKDGKPFKHFYSKEIFSLPELADWTEKVFGTRKVTRTADVSLVKLTKAAVIKTTAQLIREAKQLRERK